MCWTTSGSPFEVIIISLRLASTSSQALLSFLKRQSSSCPLATWAKLLILFESSFIFMTTGLAHPARPQLMSTIGIINLADFMLFLLFWRCGLAWRHDQYRFIPLSLTMSVFKNSNSCFSTCFTVASRTSWDMVVSIASILAAIGTRSSGTAMPLSSEPP